MNNVIKNWVIGFWASVAVIFNIAFYLLINFFDNEEGKQMFMSFGTDSLIWLLTAIFLSLGLMAVGGVFWIIMLVHAATKPIPNKAFWVILLVFGWIFGALVYYYCIKKKFETSSVPQISN